MNILTFDIEDWYNCDFISQDFDWSKFEVRIYYSLEKILEELLRHDLHATFFCLGWLAEKHPDVIRMINSQNHHIGCHSYQHQLSYRFTRDEFKRDVERASKLIEDLIGKKVNAFRAPGFSIGQSNIWAFEVLSELGFIYDSSIFPGNHDYGGFRDFGKAEPTVLVLPNGAYIKEFPISGKKLFNQNLIFSGGGYFRFYPYFLIKQWSIKSDYLMCYFHPRDFDLNQPRIKTLPLLRKYKSYVGLRKSFEKFQTYLDNFSFVNIENADIQINWESQKIIKY